MSRKQKSYFKTHTHTHSLVLQVVIVLLELVHLLLGDLVTGDEVIDLITQLLLCLPRRLQVCLQSLDICLQPEVGREVTLYFIQLFIYLLSYLKGCRWCGCLCVVVMAVFPPVCFESW